MKFRTSVRPPAFSFRLPLLFALFPAWLALVSGCAVVGNVKPIEEKSESYGILDLTKTNPEWIRLEPGSADSQGSKEIISTEISDVAYQSKSTASIISLNSACRQSSEQQEQSLSALTNLLFMGISDLALHSQKQILFQNSPALESVVQGNLNGEEMMLQTVVIRRGRCIYDLVYMARPRHFERNLKDFSLFVASLRLK